MKWFPDRRGLAAGLIAAAFGFGAAVFIPPAMAAGVTDRLWEVSNLVALLEADERGLERAV